MSNVTANATDVFGVAAAGGKAGDSSVLRNTLKVYGSMFLVLMTVFCWARVRYARVYNVRSWVETLQNKLASTHYGRVEWAWKLWWISDDDFREACGMDALCFIRILRFGLKISLLGMFNSLWLCPMYATAASKTKAYPIDDNTDHITDWVEMMTIANVPAGDSRFFGTVISAYMIFGYIMYLILQEFQWFIDQRHKYLSRTCPQNYTVYVNHIPPEFRTSSKLKDYFRRAFGEDSVLEAYVALKIPSLDKKVAARTSLIGKLEHAINIEEIKGHSPTHVTISLKDNMIDSIDAWTTRLRKENQEIREAITAIESMHDPMSFRKDLEDGGGSIAYRSNTGGYSLLSAQSSLSGPGNSIDNSMPHDGLTIPVYAKTTDSGRNGKDKVASTMKSSIRATSALAGSALKLLAGRDDGEPREAGFVTFTKLSSTQACLQMIHHPIPFTMEVAEAPDPDDIFWANVGKSHESLQLGKLAGLVCTVWLCVFWTIPVSFIASLAEIDSLKESLPFLADWIDVSPWLVPLLAQMAPLMIILINALLPVILGEFCKLEGPISSSVLEASLFVKLASFMIIQTFFVSALSGALLPQITSIIKDPIKIVSALADNLPKKSTYFVQILLVKTFLNLGLEILKITPLFIAGVRSKVGPRLTEKERNSVWMGLRPLAAPGDFAFSDVTSSAILYYMVLFVYSSMAPITSWFMFFCFVILSSCYRHQFIYNYPPTPDSGGRIWTGFISVTLPCMFVAQITLIGLLASNSAAIPVLLMLPLLVIHVLFSFYLKQQHFHATHFLPSRECLEIDLRNSAEGSMDYSFVKRKYLQPSLQNKDDAQPENLSVTREIAQHDVIFMTPPTSEAEILDDEYEPENISFNNVSPLAVGLQIPLVQSQTAAHANLIE